MGDLVGEYVLVSFNDKPSKGEIALSLRRGSQPDELLMEAVVSNVLDGTVTYDNGSLKGLLTCPRMVGPPFRMAVERALLVRLAEGLQASRDGDELTLSHSPDKLVFRTREEGTV